MSEGSEGTTPLGEPEEVKSPLQRALELCVFAPVGVAVSMVEDLPDLVDKGRRRVGLQLGNARVVGRFVVARTQRRVSSRLGELLDDDDAASGGEDADQVVPPAAPSSRPAPDPAAESIVGGALADYDTLSASQVVRRLESLGPDELRAVQRYEASTRNRRTILNRASQLLEERPAGPYYD